MNDSRFKTASRDKKLKAIVNWASACTHIRAVLLTSSLANQHAPKDSYSDLDIELVIANFDTFCAHDDWMSTFGKIIAKVAENKDVFEGKHAMRMVLYEDYVKVDFKLYSVKGFLDEVDRDPLPEDWDVGYRVLLDKDQLTTNMKAPSFQSVIIKKPSEFRYNQVLNDFWWDMTYVAKCLARDEIFYAKFMTENMMRTDYLVPLLEWYIAMRHHWKVTTNKHGRLFKTFLNSTLWKRVEETFSGSNLEDNWRALFAYADLGHFLGTQIATKLKYNYPLQLEKDIRTYLVHVKGDGMEQL